MSFDSVSDKMRWISSAKQLLNERENLDSLDSLKTTQNIRTMKIYFSKFTEGTKAILENCSLHIPIIKHN